MTRTFATAALAAALLSTPASAHCCSGGGSGWGTAVGAGILGGIIGSTLAPEPQPQVIIVQPAPVYILPQRPAATQVQDPYPGFWWCQAAHQWFQDATWTVARAGACVR